MLKSLFIQNYVLIESLDIEFANGFSVITGETGAGKSIILGALSLVLGQRADGKSIKKEADRCVIEATFDISLYQLEPFFLWFLAWFRRKCTLIGVGVSFKWLAI